MRRAEDLVPWEVNYLAMRLIYSTLTPQISEYSSGVFS